MAASQLAIGTSVRLEGRHILHWEWTRFEVRTPRRFFGSRIERCELLAADGVEADPLAVLGRPLPDGWRHHGPLAFDVIIKAVPIERGRFGHIGTLRWRLRVDEWVSVKPIE